jgi:hypothetical protein
MTTELQVRANQQNAQVSTGPRTEAGKRKVSLNAIAHGLRARPAVMQDEDAQAFEQMRGALLATLKPVGDLELLFADRAAVALWRLHRVLALEGRLLLARQAVEEGESAEQALARDLELVSKGLPGLSRYESQLEHRFGKAIAALRAEQDARAHREAEARGPLHRRRYPTPSPGPWAHIPTPAECPAQEPDPGADLGAAPAAAQHPDLIVAPAADPDPAPEAASPGDIKSDTQSEQTPSDRTNPIDLSH